MKREKSRCNATSLLLVYGLFRSLERSHQPPGPPMPSPTRPSKMINPIPGQKEATSGFSEGAYSRFVLCRHAFSQLHTHLVHTFWSQRMLCKTFVKYWHMSNSSTATKPLFLFNNLIGAESWTLISVLSDPNPEAKCLHFLSIKKNLKCRPKGM